jgi:uncharacterized protein YkwD
MFVTQNVKVRRAALVGSLVVSLTLGIGVAPSAEAGPLRTKFLNVINRVRANHDLPAIKLNVRLSDDAKSHTRKMIRRGILFDPRNLYELLEPYRWDDLGADVVGCHDSFNKMVRQWMGEGFHRSILLSPDLRKAGIGALFVGKSACGRGQIWATAIMYG